MRITLKNEDFAPSYLKISNNSADFYFLGGGKLSKTKIRSFFPLLNGVVSDDNFAVPRTEPLVIRGFEFSNIVRKPLKAQATILPKIEDNLTYKLLAKSKQIPDKPQSKKNPSKRNLVNFKEILTEKPMQRQVSPVKNKIITKVSYKEAARLAEWALIAKPELEKIWKNLIGYSNGIRPMSSGVGQYKFYVGKGNNSNLIRRLLASRSWWSPTENIEEAQFVWTQWKDKSYIATLPIGKELEHYIDTYTFPIISYQVPVRINNVYRQVDLSDLGLYKIKGSSSYAVLNSVEISPINCKLYNKLEFNQHLANKKGLFRSMKMFYEANGKNLQDCHPITFHIIQGEDDPEFSKFMDVFNKYERMKKKKKSKNIWIVKPGENSNRGNGIQVCKTIAEIKDTIKEKLDLRTNHPRTYILQKYIEKPLLVNNRKFDIRCYSLLTCINGVLQGYFYTDGYIRTSCIEFNLNDTSNNFIHLTNDAVQKHSENYGKYEDNNKMSYKDLQRYLDFQYPDQNINFFSTILPKIKNIVKDTIQAVYKKIDYNKRLNCMEVFGYDFMLDYKLKPWIIEVNTNPCLELSSSYLSYLIPTMLENAFRITLDTIYPPPATNRSLEAIPENRFDLIFHQMVDGAKIQEEIKDDVEISDDEEMFPEIDNTCGNIQIL